MASSKIFKDADLVATFAWLDFCNRNGLDFWETVAVHLSEARTQRGDDEYVFTSMQVKNKIISVLRRSGKGYSPEEVLANGSKYFDDFIINTTRRAIRKELGRYDVLHSHMLYPNSGQHGRTGIPRRTGTRSAGPCSENPAHVDLPGGVSLTQK